MRIVAKRPSLVAGVLLLIILATQSAFGGVAFGSTLTVDDTSDTLDTVPGDGFCADASGNCTLRAAIMEANANGGPDTIVLPSGTYLLTIPGASEDLGLSGDLDISGDLTIGGAGADITIIDGGALDRVLHIRAGTVEISGVTVQNGSSDEDGGGILNKGNLIIEGSTITRNTTTGVFGGGGINNDGSLVLIDSTISYNVAQETGGGFRSSVGKSASLISSVVEFNRAGFVAGGIYSINDSMLILTDSVVRYNRADCFGGGISTGTGTFILNTSIVSNNFAGCSGGGISTSGVLTLNGSTVSGNRSRSNGGGINADDQTNLINSTVNNNVADGDGGGIWFDFIGVLKLINSTVTGNEAGGNGGGIFDQAGGVNLINSTISSNVAADGGGIYIQCNVFLSSCLSDAKTANSIIATNVGQNCAGDGPIASRGYNLIGDVTGCMYESHFTDLVGTAGSPIDPLLGPLQGNGGPTRTHAMHPDSPAVDQIPVEGCRVTTDQRGVHRPQGVSCDIGAFELRQG